MRDISNVVQTVAASVDPGLEDAHWAAAEFHEAMAQAMSAREDIEAGDGSGGPCDPHWVEKYKAAMGRAAAALQKMPVQWAAVLNAKV